jgi:hypothetical protein
MQEKWSKVGLGGTPQGGPTPILCPLAFQLSHDACEALQSHSPPLAAMCVLSLNGSHSPPMDWMAHKCTN